MLSVCFAWNLALGIAAHVWPLCVLHGTWLWASQHTSELSVCFACNLAIGIAVHVWTLCVVRMELGCGHHSTRLNSLCGLHGTWLRASQNTSELSLCFAWNLAMGTNTSELSVCFAWNLAMGIAVHVWTLCVFCMELDQGHRSTRLKSLCDLYGTWLWAQQYTSELTETSIPRPVEYSYKPGGIFTR